MEQKLKAKSDSNTKLVSENETLITRLAGVSLKVQAITENIQGKEEEVEKLQAITETISQDLQVAIDAKETAKEEMKEKTDRLAAMRNRVETAQIESARSPTARRLFDEKESLELEV